MSLFSHRPVTHPRPRITPAVSLVDERHYGEIARIERSTNDPIKYDDIRRYLDRPRVIGWVALEPGGKRPLPLGWCAWVAMPGRYRIKRLVVDPAMRRHGVATALVERLERKLGTGLNRPDEEEPRTVIECICNEWSDDLVRFFASRGWHGELLRGCFERLDCDAIRMSLGLPTRS